MGGDAFYNLHTIISSWIVSLATVESPDHPPVPGHLIKTGDCLYGLLIAPLADPVPGVVIQALLINKALDEINELWVLIAMGHLTNVGAGSDSVFRFRDDAFVTTG